MGQQDYTHFPQCSIQELDDLIASGALRDHAKELFLGWMERTPGDNKWLDAFLMVFFLPGTFDDIELPPAARERGEGGVIEPFRFCLSARSRHQIADIREQAASLAEKAQGLPPSEFERLQPLLESLFRLLSGLGENLALIEGNGEFIAAPADEA